MFRILTILTLTAAALSAAPKLRLSATTIGPLIIASGQNGTLQTIDAGNFGDGTLILTASANVPWITAGIGPTRACALHSICSPVQIALNTATLARGKYTGTVTVSDPNAVDAPQTIVVMVQIGGVPDSIEVFLPPNSTRMTSFSAAVNRMTATVNSPGGGTTLSLAQLGGGSFDFAFSYQVTATAGAVAENDYRGSIVVSGSNFPGDNKTVPVTLHVTSQPIAKLDPESLRFRAAQGAAKFDKWVQVLNSGSGTLAVTGVTIPSSATWLTAKLTGNLIVLTADPTGLSPGAYQTTVAVASNARNGPLSVPVQMDVVATGPPVSFFQGVLDNALIAPGDPVAQGGIVEIVGEQFTTGEIQQAQTLPLGTSMGGATVFVNNVPAPIYYVAASHVVNQGGQINFQIPYDTPSGEAVVRVDRDGQRGNSVTVQVKAAVPRLLAFQPYQGSLAGYAIAVINDGSGNTIFPIPATPGVLSRPAKTDDVLTFYALGFGQTSPAVTAGLAAPGVEPLARVAPLKVVFGQSLLPGSGVLVDPSYAGLTPSSVGLYQINVAVPAEAPRGDAVPIYIDMGNNILSNRVNIAIQ
jgi:uncharacterized protein (TIGR03437 family)